MFIIYPPLLGVISLTTLNKQYLANMNLFAVYVIFTVIRSPDAYFNFHFFKTL